MNYSIPYSSPEPFFFGPSAQELYGCLYSPPSGPLKQTTVVICQPIGDEYVRSHRACCQLAQRLARSGFPVLRFDYFGCGDSAGDEIQASLPRWEVDVASAAAEALRCCPVSKLCLIGLRLGGALALRASENTPDVETIVLWDPVTDGRRYLHELRERDERKRRGLSRRDRCSTRDDEWQDELLGYSYSPRLREEIESIGDRPAAKTRARRVLVFESEPRKEADSLAECVQSDGTMRKHCCVPDHQVWKSDAERMLVPHRLLQALVGSMNEVCA